MWPSTVTSAPSASTAAGCRTHPRRASERAAPAHPGCGAGARCTCAHANSGSLLDAVNRQQCRHAMQLLSASAWSGTLEVRRSCASHTVSHWAFSRCCTSRQRFRDVGVHATLWRTSRRRQLRCRWCADWLRTGASPPRCCLSAVLPAPSPGRWKSNLVCTAACLPGSASGEANFQQQ